MINPLKITLPLILLSGIFFFSCNQDSIFNAISNETELIEPRIKGSPTNIVISDYTGNNSVFAASIGSSTIHRYSGGGWSAFGVPGSIGELAATDKHLYAILNDRSLHQVSTGKSVVPGGMLQSVFAADDRIFVGRGYPGSYSVVCYNENLVSVSLTGVSGLLQGAVKAGGNYFIATSDSGGGIYKISGTTVTSLVTGNIKGIISVKNYIIAIASDGTLYYFLASNPASISSYSLGDDGYTGAMSYWSSNNSTTYHLLLLGIEGSGSNRGYREVYLDTTTGAPSGGKKDPGTGSPTTIQNQARYRAAIGKHAIYSIRQVPLSPVIFASTTQHGLWSLRNDQWNGEE